MTAIDDITAGQDLDDAAKVRVAQGLIEQAAVEYRDGVVNGEIADLQEYQDARGFLQIAEKFVAQCAGSPQRDTLLAQLQSAKVLWPNLNPKGAIPTDMTTLVRLIGQLATAAELASP